MSALLQENDKILIRGHYEDDCNIISEMTQDFGYVEHIIFFTYYPSLRIHKIKENCDNYQNWKIEVTWKMWPDYDLTKLNQDYDLIYKVGASKELILIGGKRYTC